MPRFEILVYFAVAAALGCAGSPDVVGGPKAADAQCANGRCPVPLPGGGIAWVSQDMTDFIGCIRNVGLENVETTVGQEVGGGVNGKVLSGEVEASLKSGLTAKAVAKYQTDSTKVAQIQECNKRQQQTQALPALSQPGSSQADAGH